MKLQHGKNYSLAFIRRLELKPISEQKVEHIFIAPPYCQTDVNGSAFVNTIEDLLPI
jgi:hypothetical protein